MDTLVAGSERAQSGSRALGSGAQRLGDSLASGAEKIPAYGADDVDNVSTVISSPVNVDPIRDNAVANNGAGFTPMFLSLSLWIGAIAMFLVFRALERRTSLDYPWWKGPIRPAIRGAAMGVTQAVLLILATNWLVGLRAANLPGLVVMAIAASLTFVAFNQMLIASLSYRGRFVSILLLCLQIASMGATFPIETAPKFFQVIHAWLPMSYTQLAFRELIAGEGASMAVGRALLILAIWFVVSVAITFYASYKRNSVRPLPKDNALLGDILEAAAQDQAHRAHLAQKASEA
ncbi:MAG: hypothetical protein CSA82_00720 [Actinobacteria bacterium]|nr:MAG: hypothetical protein CSA82_00720 [Actinomycetota bacterium]